MMDPRRAFVPILLTLSILPPVVLAEHGPCERSTVSVIPVLSTAGACAYGDITDWSCAPPEGGVRDCWVELTWRFSGAATAWGNAIGTVAVTKPYGTLVWDDRAWCEWTTASGCSHEERDLWTPFFLTQPEWDSDHWLDARVDSSVNGLAGSAHAADTDRLG